MGKILLLVALALVAYLVIKAMIRVRRGPGAGPEPPERMVACQRCGPNLPQSEALESEGKFFCCEDHRRGTA